MKYEITKKIAQNKAGQGIIYVPKEVMQDYDLGKGYVKITLEK